MDTERRAPMPWPGVVGIGLLILAGLGYLSDGVIPPVPGLLGVVLLCTGLIMRSVEQGRRAAEQASPRQ